MWFFHCVVLSVKVHNVLFVLNGELILMTLNKQTNTTIVNLKGEFICFILCDTILKNLFWYNGDWTTISWQAWSLVSLEALWRSNGPSVTLGFWSKTRKKRFSSFSQNLTKEKKLDSETPRCARTKHYYAFPILLCFSDIFLQF